jgi:TatA/E family protein of Tat protein translocase
MFGFGTTELILVLATFVLFFGAKKVSDLAREVGEAVKYLRKSFSDEKDENNKGKTS